MDGLWNESFVLFTKISVLVSQLTDTETAQLFRAILHYQATGEVPEMDRVVSLVFAQAKADMDYCMEQRNAQREKNKLAGQKSAEARSAKASMSEHPSTPLNAVEHSSTPLKHVNHNRDGDIYGDGNGNGDVMGIDNKTNTPQPPSPGGGDGVEVPERKKQSQIIEERFERFWKLYPRRQGKGDARKAFVKINPSEALLGQMASAIAAASASYQWQKDKGQFIPLPATWLNQERWLDEVRPDMGRPDPVARAKLNPKVHNLDERPPEEDSYEAAVLQRMRKIAQGGAGNG